MDFYKLIIKFWKSCNEIGKSIFGRTLKIIFFLIQTLEREVQEYLKLVLKIKWHNFLKKTRKPLFWPFTSKY